MTALTLWVIWKNPPVTLHEICKIFSKILRTPLIHGHFHIAAKFTKFKENLFLMTAFKVYHMCRKHGVGVGVASALMGGGQKNS